MNLQKKLKLQIGTVEASLEAIYQWNTYEGLMEGLPTKENNQQIIGYAVEKAASLFEFDRPYLIAPTETPIERKMPYPTGKPMAMPPIVCAAKLTTFSYTKDPEYDYSSIVVLWCQDDYCFPISEVALDAMKKIDWAKHCQDFYF